MSGITEVRSYFRTHMDALNFREWKDGFNFENVPSTLLDKSYHIETPGGSRRDLYDMQSQDVEVDVVVRVFRKGYRNPADAIDAIMVNFDSITERVLASSRRLGANIKNIAYTGHTVAPLADSNDNSAVLEINFICFIVICV